MVRKLDVFREYFAGHADQFLLIGGTAATLAMEEAGLEFRATKDLDIVLHIEAWREPASVAATPDTTAPFSIPTRQRRRYPAHSGGAPRI